jgi:hypothetical protein
MFFVWSSVKNDPKITDITSEMVAVREKTSGVIKKTGCLNGVVSFSPPKLQNSYIIFPYKYRIFRNCQVYNIAV